MKTMVSFPPTVRNGVDPFQPFVEKWTCTCGRQIATSLTYGECVECKDCKSQHFGGIVMDIRTMTSPDRNKQFNENWVCECGREITATLYYGERVECSKCSSPHFGGIEVDANGVEEAKTRFRANMTGVAELGNKSIERLIKFAEEGRTSDQSLMRLEEAQASALGGLGTGLNVAFFGLVLGAAVASGAKRQAKQRLSTCLPLTGPLTGIQKEVLRVWLEKSR